MNTTVEQLYNDIDDSLDSQFRQQQLNKLICTYTTGHTVLDVGCGSGTLLSVLASCGYDVYGCDPSLLQCKLARKRLRKKQISSQRIQQLSLEQISVRRKKYDTVVCIDVIEHINNDQHVVKQLLSLTKPRGRVIIVVPALPLLWSKRDEMYGHYRRYTKKTLYALFDSLPKKRIYLRYWNCIGAVVTFFLFKLGLAVETDKLAVAKSLHMRTIHTIFRMWLNSIEAHIAFPFGMSLIAVVDKP